MSIKELSLRQLSQRMGTSKDNSRSNLINNYLRKQLLSQLQLLKYGSLVINENGMAHHTQSQNPKWVEAQIIVHDAQFYRFITLGGSVGAAEAYILGYWSSPDLTKVIRLFAINQSTMDDMESGIAKITIPVKKIFHWLNKNTTHGSKRNIAAHYDLGNELFTHFLDPSMMYSSGIYQTSDSSLEQASVEKIDRICRRLNLQESDHVMEIGTGWGGFAIHAAKNYGCKVTTTTISKQQYDFAKAQIKELELEDRVELLFEDYRKVTGKFDKVVSIEMIEAVGHHYYDEYFAQCSHLLKADGEFLLQAITIADQRFNSAKKEIDYIKRYIFPGSCIPSINAISSAVTKSSDLRIVNLFDMGQHYAKTLMDWYKNFNQDYHSLESQGYDQQFRNMWNFYLCYCAGGFQEGVISVVQIHLIKPLARPTYYVNEVNDY